MILNKKNYQIKHRHQLIYIDHYRIIVNMVIKVNIYQIKSTDSNRNKNDYQYHLRNNGKIQTRNHWIEK